MFRIYYNKILIKRISLLICFLVLIGLINTGSMNVNALDTEIGTEPSFTIEMNPLNPNPAMVGEDITVSGTITPKPFEFAKKKQVVLVLDVSGSMEDGMPCTNQRVRHYITSIQEYNELYYQGIKIYKDNSYDYGYVAGHTYVEDYCEEHKKVGEHQAGNSKIDQLKIAANNFIDRMKNIPNLEISIVAYSTNATINPTLEQVESSYYNNKYDFATKESKNANGESTGAIQDYKGSELGFMTIDNDDKVKKVKDMIDNLQALGGTNAGEGLRKAEYLLEIGDKDASKSVIFMSDGQPTFYSVDSSDKSTYYTNIDNSDPSYLGTGSDYDENAKKYATQIGTMIKEEKANIFSIGYGLGSEYSTGNLTMQEIHKAMGGSTSDGSFFATDVGAIDSVLNKIADKIIEQYMLTDVKINLNLGSDFTLTGGENTVELSDINYVLQPSNDGKMIYKSDPIPFSFTIKGNKPGNYENVLQGATLSAHWDGGDIITDIPKEGVTITGNILPNINAHLISPTPNTVVDPSQPIAVTYKIDTEPFEYNLTNALGGMIDEAVFVVDLTENMDQGNRWKIMKNEFTNVLLDNQNGRLINQSIKFGVVGYNDSVKYPTENGEYDRLFDRSKDDEREKLRIWFQNDIMKPESNTNTRNIGQALQKADDLLQNKGEVNRNKAIVLINSGNVNYNQADIASIKNRGYKIISVDMSCDKNQNPTANLKTLHSDLQGIDDDYLNSKNDGDNFNFVNIDMQNVADRLKAGSTPKTLSVRGAKLNFDLGENFDADENSGLDGTGKVRTVTLPEIKYTLMKDDASGKYLWQQDPQSLEIKFNIKPAQGKTGVLGFANDSENDDVKNLKNYISYNRLDGMEIKKHIETPVVNIGLPNINAKLISATPNPANPGQEIDVTYQIDTDPFKYNSVNSGSGAIDEAVFVVDLSHRAKTAGGDREELMSPWFEKILLNDEANIFQGQNIKYSVVGYNGTEEYPASGGQYDKLFDPSNGTERGNLLDSINNMLTKIQKNNKSKKSDIGLGLEKANKILTDAVDNKRKAVILVNCSDINDSLYYSTIINTVKTKGYKIISLNMNWAPGQIKKSDLPYLHEALGGADSDYLISGAYNNHKGSPEEDMIEIAKRLNPGGSSSVVIQNAKLNFDLGENFDAYEDSGPSGLEGTGKVRTISIPNIEYTLEKDSTGKSLWHQKEPITKTFKVKSAPGKFGQLGFGFYANSEIKSSSISYNDLGGVFINKIIDTPIITINPLDIKHGIYKGIVYNNGKQEPKIDNSENYSFVKDSIIPMGASFNFYGDTTINLELAPKLEKFGDIKVYKINPNSGELILIGTMAGSGSNYETTISGNSLSNGDTILVLYDIKASEDGKYTNFISVGNSEKVPAKIIINGDLPELF